MVHSDTHFFLCLIYVPFLLQTHLPSPYPSPSHHLQPTPKPMLTPTLMTLWRLKALFKPFSQSSALASTSRHYKQVAQPVFWHGQVLAMLAGCQQFRLSSCGRRSPTLCGKCFYHPIIRKSSKSYARLDFSSKNEFFFFFSPLCNFLLLTNESKKKFLVEQRKWNEVLLTRIIMWTILL